MILPTNSKINYDEVNRAKKFAWSSHSKVNSLYDGKPYGTHLQLVSSTGTQFISYIRETDQESVLMALWLHDVLEDCNLTYNDLAKEFGTTIAELVYDVTNELGKNRKELD